METLAFVLSTLGTACICIPPLLKGKKMKAILLFLFLANGLVAASYLLTGGLNGAVSCSVGAAQTIINYFFDRKGKKIPLWLIGIYAAAFTVVNLLVFSSATDVLALVACYVSIVCICQKNGKKFRFWALVNTVLWLIYDLLTLSFGPMTTHGIQIATILGGIFLHDLKKNKN